MKKNMCFAIAYGRERTPGLIQQSKSFVRLKTPTSFHQNDTIPHPNVGKMCGILTSRMEYYPNSLFVCIHTHTEPKSCGLGQKWETGRGRFPRGFSFPRTQAYILASEFDVKAWNAKWPKLELAKLVPTGFQCHVDQSSHLWLLFWASALVVAQPPIQWGQNIVSVCTLPSIRLVESVYIGCRLSPWFRMG